MNNRSTYQFCNNCGKQGHLFNQCKNPIISSGIIAFRKKQNTITECKKGNKTEHKINGNTIK